MDGIDLHGHLLGRCFLQSKEFAKLVGKPGQGFGRPVVAKNWVNFAALGSKENYGKSNSLYHN
jgi:hypothetical protein